MTNPTSVSDKRANKNENIVHVAEVIGRSEHRLKVFQAVYYHKKRLKPIDKIINRSQLTRKQVLNAAGTLSSQEVIGKRRIEGVLHYSQDPFIQANKAAILRIVRDPKRKDSIPTKQRPQAKTTRAEASQHRAKWVTIDDLSSFRNVSGIAPTTMRVELLEEDVKEGLQVILEELGDFKDWGGETSDIYTTRLRVRQKRVRAALALKGRATRGKLTPGKLGRNGDQIQRLFKAPADLFVVQYVGQVQQTVVEQMKIFAEQKASSEQREIYYMVIDGQDTSRILAAYPSAFPSLT